MQALIIRQLSWSGWLHEYWPLVSFSRYLYQGNASHFHFSDSHCWRHVSILLTWLSHQHEDTHFTLPLYSYILVVPVLILSLHKCRQRFTHLIGPLKNHLQVFFSLLFVHFLFYRFPLLSSYFSSYYILWV